MLCTYIREMRIYLHQINNKTILANSTHIVRRNAQFLRQLVAFENRSLSANGSKTYCHFSILFGTKTLLRYSTA